MVLFNTVGELHRTLEAAKAILFEGLEALFIAKTTKLDPLKYKKI